MDAQNFSGRLRELRTAAGLTQGQLAERVGLHRVALARLEAGSIPAWDTVLAICTALGVSCEEFRQAPADAPRKGPGRPPRIKADDAGAAAEPKKARRKKSK
jgi:transcriptional regulator with XRE-family HTH domain